MESHQGAYRVEVLAVYEEREGHSTGLVLLWKVKAKGR